MYNSYAIVNSTRIFRNSFPFRMYEIRDLGGIYKRNTWKG